MIDLEEQIKIGKVSSVDVKKRTARVIFEDKEDMVSGELKVLINQPLTHDLHVEIHPWLPSVGQFVLCAFPSIGGGDGFILGGF